MFKIGEFSKLTQVTIRMLRHYDEIGLLKPAFVDEWTGYRMYSVEQIPVLNKIIYLKDNGFSLSEIAKIIEENNDEFVIKQLDDKYLEIEKLIQSEYEKLRKIELAKKEILLNKSDMHFNVLIKSVPSYKVLSLRKIIPNYYAEGQLWQELSCFAKEHNVEISDNSFSVYYDMDYKEENVDVELCVPVKKTGKNVGNFIYKDTESVDIMAYTMVYGEFSNIARAYIAFAQWLQKNSRYKMQGYNRQIVHRGPWNENNPKNYLIELQIPLEKA